MHTRLKRRLRALTEGVRWGCCLCPELQGSRTGVEHGSGQLHKLITVDPHTRATGLSFRSWLLPCPTPDVIRMWTASVPLHWQWASAAGSCLCLLSAG